MVIEYATLSAIMALTSLKRAKRGISTRILRNGMQIPSRSEVLMMLMHLSEPFSIRRRCTSGVAAHEAET